MILFNELRYSYQRKYLIIDVSIEDMDYFKDMYIDTIRIENQNKYIPDQESTVIYEWPNEIDTPSEDDNRRRVRLKIPVKPFKIDPENDILFVTVNATGNDMDIPCSINEAVKVGTVINTYALYRRMINYLTELLKTCKIPKKLIDEILRYKSLEVCVKTGNYPLLVKLWQLFNSRFKFNNIIEDCGCNGKNF